MIYDKIGNLSLYKGIYPNLDKAIDYLTNNDIGSLKEGKNIVSGEEIFINRVHGKLISVTDGVFEYHRKYLDIHIDISGKEALLITDSQNAEVTNDYQEEGDYALLKGKSIAECQLGRGYFAICMLEEPHMPCVAVDEDKEVDKVIVKVLVG